MTKKAAKNTLGLLTSCMCACEAGSLAGWPAGWLVPSLARLLARTLTGNVVVFVCSSSTFYKASLGHVILVARLANGRKRKPAGIASNGALRPPDQCPDHGGWMDGWLNS